MEQLSMMNAGDSDAEGGPLVIDEGDKKKSIKRKAPSTPAASNMNSTTPSSNQVRFLKNVNLISTCIKFMPIIGVRHFFKNT